MVHKTKVIRCAIYTRKSSEEGLEQEFNSLHAQREACEAYIKSQRHEGWSLIPTLYDDGGFSGGSMDRPALTRLIADIKNNTIDIVVVYKVDRLSRSLSDFVKLVEMLNEYNASFVSVTQQFNTSTSMGRLTLNVLLSFAQFEREVTGERIRDKIAASKQKGMWMGGCVPLGYDLKERDLFINKKEAQVVKHIYEQYLKIGNVKQLKKYLEDNFYVSKVRLSKTGKQSGGNSFTRGMLYSILKNPIYNGMIRHKKKQYEGRHKALLATETWQQVQDLLAKNNHKHVTRSSSKSPSLFSGLIFDDQGFPMSPVQAKKRNKHYRYYVSQALMQYKDDEAGSVTRISAGEIEAPVTRALIKLLSNSSQLLDVFKDNNLDTQTQSTIIKQATTFVNNWSDMSNSSLIHLYKILIERIVVSRNEIIVDVSVQGLADTLKQEVQSVVPHQLLIPAQLKRCGLEMKLIIDGDEQLAISQSSLNTLQESLSKGLYWHDHLVSGQLLSINQIAKNESVNRIYILRRVRMAYLAPDIIKAIIKGQMPHTMNFSQIKDGFPLDWGEQRRLFGFT